MSTLTKHASALAAKVAAVNAANAYANELRPALVAALVPFIGSKVLKVTGELLEKVKAALPDFSHTVSFSIYRHRSNYSLAWTVKTCELYGEHSCIYHETTVYVCDLDNGVAKPLTGTVSTFRTDYTEREVFDLRAACSAAKQAARTAESALFPFGEYDR